jgi:arsenate reductase (thioredoxin)
VNSETRNILFLCTGNSARSIMAETILNHAGRGKYKAFSAASHPTGKVNPYALPQLARAKLAVEGLRSKDWNEFAQSGAPELDFVFTVCDNAAGEVCPVWSGQPVTAHWGVEDPAAVTGTEEEIDRAFFNAFEVLNRRIQLFVSLPFASLDDMAIRKRVADIGKQ